MNAQHKLLAARRAARRRLARHAPHLLQTATRCARAGNTPRATRMAHTITRLAPDYPTAWNVLGDLWFVQGEALAAAIALDKCLALDPDAATAHATFGELALRAGVPTVARPHLERALRGDALPARRRTWVEALLRRC